MNHNIYLVVWGIKVSGHKEYSSVELVRGQSLQDAVNDRPLKGDAIVLQAFEVEKFPNISLRRIV